MFLRLVSIGLLLCSTPAWAAISFIATSNDDNTTSTTSTPAEPTGTTEDDVVVAWCVDTDNTGAWTDPADFTEITQKIPTQGNNTGELYLGYKVRGATAGSGYTFTYSVSANINCGLLTFRGVDTTTSLDLAYVEGSHYNDDIAWNTAAQPITTVTDGAWVVLLQAMSSTISGAAGPPSGYTERADYLTGAFAHRGLYAASKEVASFGTETPGAFTHTDDDINPDPDNRNFTIALRPAASGPSFTSGPTEAPATDGFTISGTLSGSGTLTAYAVGVNPGDGTPTCAQIKSGNNDGGTSADLSANEVWTTDVGDSFLLTKSGAWPRYDIHVCGSDGTIDTAVTSFTDQDRSADTNQDITVTTSISTTSPFALQSENTCDTTNLSDTITGCADTSWVLPGTRLDLSAGFADLTDVIVLAVTSSTVQLEDDANSTTSNITITQDQYYSPTVATGDVIEGDDTVSCAAGTDAVTWQVDGDFNYTATTCGSTLTTLDYNIQDVSDASDGDFDSGPPAWTAGDDTFYLFNTQPLFDVSDTIPVVLTEDVAMSTINLAIDCNDDDGHALTFTVRTGTVPNGTTISSAGSWTGTPDTEDEAGEVLDIVCEDVGGLAMADTLTSYVVNTWTMPDITGDTVSAAAATIVTSAPWRVGIYAPVISVSFACDGSVAADDIISQTPVASSENAWDVEFSAVVSVGTVPCASRWRRSR